MHSSDDSILYSKPLTDAWTEAFCRPRSLCSPLHGTRMAKRRSEGLGSTTCACTSEWEATERRVGTLLGAWSAWHTMLLSEPNVELTTVSDDPEDIAVGIFCHLCSLIRFCTPTWG